MLLTYRQRRPLLGSKIYINRLCLCTHRWVMFVYLNYYLCDYWPPNHTVYLYALVPATPPWPLCTLLTPQPSLKSPQTKKTSPQLVLSHRSSFSQSPLAVSRLTSSGRNVETNHSTLNRSSCTLERNWIRMDPAAPQMDATSIPPINDR